MTQPTKLPTVAEFFAQYAEKGHVWPEPGLRALLRNNLEGKVCVILSSYAHKELPVRYVYSFDVDGDERIVTSLCALDGLSSSNDKSYSEDDIIAVLDGAGNVIAGEG
jgi:hypothetical protein